MKLRAALESAYFPNATIAPTTTRCHRHNLNRWESLTDDPDVKRITTDTFREFRKACRDRGLSNDSIEGTVTTVLIVLRMLHRLGKLVAVPWCGPKLERAVGPKWVPTLDQFARCYRFAYVAQWPRHCDPGVWFRAFLVCGYWTGLRLGDLWRELRWIDLQPDRILFGAASKTGKVHVFPQSPVVQRHLDALPRIGDRVFETGRSLKQLRRELHRISRAAGVEPALTAQPLRRLSATAWEETRTGAGQVIQGSAIKGSARHYIAPTIVPQILAEAAPYVPWPDCCLTPKERRRDRAETVQFLRTWRKLASADREAVAALAERLVS